VLGSEDREMNAKAASVHNGAYFQPLGERVRVATACAYFAGHKRNSVRRIPAEPVYEIRNAKYGVRAV
jgi:hypothetical protein